MSPMSQRAFRILLSVLVIGGSLTWLMAMTLREDARYYKYVDEVMAQPSEWYGKKLKLHGVVVDPEHRPGTADYRFVVKHGDSTVVATYTGQIPDTFKAGSEVVLTGTLSPNGFHVDPRGVTAKCPSRYEAGTPTTPGGY